MHTLPFHLSATSVIESVLHAQVLEIQASLPAPPNTTKRMMAGTYVAYVVVAWCYWGVGLSGYYAFGELQQAPSIGHKWRPVDLAMTPMLGYAHAFVRQ